MSARSPVVIVGGGLGGLSAGVTLAQAGRAPVLFEKEPRVGGYAIAYRREGYGFDLALHAVAAGGPGQLFRRVTDDLGLDVEFLRLEDGFRVFLGGDEFRLPNRAEEIFVALADWFPEERQGLARLRRHAERHAAAYAPLFDEQVSKWRSVPRFLPRLPAFLRHGGESTASYLSRFVRGPALRALLFQPAVFLGVPLAELPAVNYLMMFHFLFGDGLYTIAGGGQALTAALERRFLELGGQLVRGQAVSRIIVEDGAVRGVMTADGETHPARAVIAASNLPAVVDEMVGRERFPRSYLETLDGLGNSLSVVALMLGLRRPARELGIDTHLSVVFPSADLDRCFAEQRSSLSVEGYSVTAPPPLEPGQEARKAVVSMVGGTDARQWLGLDRRGYRGTKERVTAQMLETLERRFPGVAAAAAVRDLVTPATLARYTGNPGGAIMGFACGPGQHRELFRAARPPIRGLHLAGAWTDKMGGMMQAVRAGVAAGRRVARQVGS